MGGRMKNSRFYYHWCPIYLYLYMSVCSLSEEKQAKLNWILRTCKVLNATTHCPLAANSLVQQIFGLVEHICNKDLGVLIQFLLILGKWNMTSTFPPFSIYISIHKYCCSWRGWFKDYRTPQAWEIATSQNNESCIIGLDLTCHLCYGDWFILLLSFCLGGHSIMSM